MSLIRQLSLLGAEAVPPDPRDLAGLLAGPGQVSRSGGSAQVSVLVDHPWRAAALVAECARRAVAATSIPATLASRAARSASHAAPSDDHIVVRTAFSALLTPLAEDWLVDSVKRAPRGLILDGRMLRLWAIAGGRFEAGRSGSPAAPGYVLPIDQGDETHWETIGAALAAVGIAGQLVSPRGQLSASYRIVGKRRLDRLAEMIGEPPKQAPVGIWPS